MRSATASPDRPNNRRPPEDDRVLPDAMQYYGSMHVYSDNGGTRAARKPSPFELTTEMLQKFSHDFVRLTPRSRRVSSTSRACAVHPPTIRVRLRHTHYNNPLLLHPLRRSNIATTRSRRACGNSDLVLSVQKCAKVALPSRVLRGCIPLPTSTSPSSIQRSPLEGAYKFLRRGWKRGGRGGRRERGFGRLRRES